MTTITLDLEPELEKQLSQLNLPLSRADRELIVLELYRRGAISSGMSAELLSMGRIDFINYASRLGIPFIDMTDEEWEAEKRQSEAL